MDTTIFAAFSLLTLSASSSLSPDMHGALSRIQAPNIAAHLARLASDEFEGRGPGTRGETLTIQYLAAQFEEFGLKPGNPDGTFFQKVPLVGYVSVPKIEIEMGSKRVALAFLDDFVHDRVTLKPRVSAKNVDVVFAGYGIEAPMYGWDDYKGLDVRGKLVIVLGGEPSDPVLFKGKELRTLYSTRDFKFDLAAAKGAAGILIVSDPEKSPTYSVFQTFAKMEGNALQLSREKSAPLITGLITVNAARRVLSLAGKDLDQLQTAASQPGSHAFTLGAHAEISIQSRIRTFVSHNVVARVEGSDPLLKAEHVLYTAHWDHLGRDSSLTGDQIYNGAIDNAAGTSQLLEVARAFAALNHKPRRSILFVATTAEEKGFLGSRFYVQRPLVPIARTVASINLDGGNVWGRTSDLIGTAYGMSTLDESFVEAARLQGRTFVKESIDDNGLYYASDQVEFAKAGIPAAFPFSGFAYIGKPEKFGEEKWSAYSEADYHQVSDHVKADWDLTGAAEDAQWMMITGHLVADSEQRPEWKPGSEFSRK